MQLCVGAVSRRVVEEAAKLRVHQIVASRGQVDINGGYTGMNQSDLVQIVREYGDRFTHVVRDHGGPLQGIHEDDGTESLDADVAAGFDSLHLDVCKLPRADQVYALTQLLYRYRDALPIEIGDEHGEQSWNERLLDVALDCNATVSYCVVNFGTYAWADRQYGIFSQPSEIIDDIHSIHARVVRTKMHNADDMGCRQRYAHLIDAYNIAPEFGKVEIDALLTVLPFKDAEKLLNYAYASGRWTRWFSENEGTWIERAKCALRYVQRNEWVTEITDNLSTEQDEFIRSCISDAIKRG